MAAPIILPHVVPTELEGTASRPRVGGMWVDASAARRLLDLAQGRTPPVVMRVIVAGGGCSGFRYDLALDAPQEDDDVVWLGPEGSVGVAVDPVSAPFLQGAVLVFEDTMAARRFRIDNPNATASCGCGTSFAI